MNDVKDEREVFDDVYFERLYVAILGGKQRKAIAMIHEVTRNIHDMDKLIAELINISAQRPTKRDACGDRIRKILSQIKGRLE